MKWFYVFLLAILTGVVSVMLLHTYAKTNKKNGMIQSDYGKLFLFATMLSYSTKIKIIMHDKNI